MLLHIPAVLSPQEVAQARMLLDAALWQDGRDTAGPQASLVKNNS